MLQNPCKTFSFMKNMVYIIPPWGGGKPYPASGLLGTQCRCDFIEMYIKYVVVFHWNKFDIYIQLLPDYTLIWFIETEWHKHLIIRIVKHRP